MDISQPDYSLQARTSSLENVLSGLRKVFITDPGLPMQILLTIPIIAAGVVFHLNAIQWILIMLATLLFVVAGILRSAALIQVKKDSSLSPFHVSRIKCMGNAIVTITAGLSLFTYLMVFVPRISSLL